MTLCNWRSAAAACLSATQAVRRADFERVMAEALQCAGPQRPASFNSRSKQYSSLNRRNCSIALKEEGVSNTIKTEYSCRMELRMADGMTRRSPSLILALFFSLRASSVTKGHRSPMTRSAAYASSKMHQSGLAGLKRIGAHPSENSHAISRIGDAGV